MNMNRYRLVLAILAIPVAIIKWKLPAINQESILIQAILDLYLLAPSLSNVRDCLQLLPLTYFPNLCL